jgi:hypothetical protein
MTDPSRYPDTGGTPRWVKVLGIIALVVALLVVVMLLIGGGGGHGPGRHAAGGDTPTSSIADDRAASRGLGGGTPTEGGY